MRGGRSRGGRHFFSDSQRGRRTTCGLRPAHGRDNGDRCGRTHQRSERPATASPGPAAAARRGLDSRSRQSKTPRAVGLWGPLGRCRRLLLCFDDGCSNGVHYAEGRRSARQWRVETDRFDSSDRLCPGTGLQHRERARHLGGVPVSIFTVRLQAFRDDGLESGRNARAAIAKRFGLGVEDSGEDFADAIAIERHRAGQELIDGHAERPESPSVRRPCGRSAPVRATCRPASPRWRFR